MTKTEAIKTLLEHIKQGDTIYTILRHRARSGMSRSISLLHLREGVPWEIDYFAAIAMGNKIDDKNGGIKIGGCGMDMGFELVYRLGHTIWSNASAGDSGYSIKQRWL